MGSLEGKVITNEYILKLIVHHKPSDDILYNEKDLPNINVGDILEIYQKEEDCRLLLQIEKLPSNDHAYACKEKDSISLSHTLAKKFEFKPNNNVVVTIKKTDDLISLQLVELIFKDQYYSRADMYLIRSSLVKKCLYHGQKIALLDMKVCVEEMWMDGIRVSCGVVSDETRVCFRSLTAQVNIFIQMSNEMWNFDNYGYLYFEKAVDGYLYDLFNLWKEKNCAHDVTITLFSRLYYDAKSIKDFPSSMRSCIQVDNSGCFYEDFYRVVVQNERYEDWFKTIKILKKIFLTYQTDMLTTHNNSLSETKDKGNDKNIWISRMVSGSNSLTIEQTSSSGENIIIIPKTYVSSASQGNILEVINLGLNSYENFHLDRGFERTGKLSIIITPDTGIFEINRQLMNITKQRTIDIGSSCDLVCLGEKPLHAVPLFKIKNDLCHQNSKDSTSIDYNIPHWLNTSYYLSLVQMECIKQKKVMLKIGLLNSPSIHTNSNNLYNGNHKSNSKLNRSINKMSESKKVPFIDYDEYDANVFKYKESAGIHEKFSYQLNNTYNKDHHSVHKERIQLTIGADSLITQPKDIERIRISETSIDSNSEDFLPHSYSGKSIAKKDFYSLNCKRLASSLTFPYNHHRLKNLQNLVLNSKALVNPFAPSRLNFKATSNRRRWAHSFPTDPLMKQSFSRYIPSPTRDSFSTEQLMFYNTNKPLSLIIGPRQQKLSECSESNFHHHVGSYIDSPKDFRNEFANPGDHNLNTLGYCNQKMQHVGSYSSAASSSGDVAPGTSFNSILREKNHASRPHQLSIRLSEREANLSWGLNSSMSGYKSSESEVQIEADLKMDWKSMTVPAILPISTGYFPDRQNLEMLYLVSEYTMIEEERSNINLLNSNSTMNHSYLKKVPTLKQVFDEMIYQRLAQGFQIVISPRTTNKTPNTSVIRQYPIFSQIVREETLSMGRLFHKLKLTVNSIIVKRLIPRHSLLQYGDFKYNYRFKIPNSLDYDISWTEFKTQRLDLYNWNYIDHQLLTQGEESNQFLETLKYWRVKFILLPSNNTGSKKIQEGSEFCNVYEERDHAEKQNLIDNFLKFAEAFNRLKKDVKKKELSAGRRGSISVQDKMTHIKSDKKEDISPSIHSRSMDFQENSLNSFNLFISTPFHDILKSMLDLVNGVTLLKSPQDYITLPPYCFISADCVNWVRKNVGGAQTVSEAVCLMQKFVDHKYVCHISGDDSIPFIYGFKLYCFFNKSKPEEFLNICLMQHIEQTIAEVEVFTQSRFDDMNILKQNNASSHSISNKYIRIDLDSKKERQEWCILKFCPHYHTCNAFEMNIEWLVATGTVLSELIWGWSRKVIILGFHLLPVPVDPFALPFAPNSDPLRGPVFIPLNIGCLKKLNNSEILHENNSNQLIGFQDAILRVYGFMRDRCFDSSKPLDNKNKEIEYEELPRYIHCSGGMLMMIVSTIPCHVNEPYNFESTPNISRRGISTNIKKQQSNDQLISDYMASNFDSKSATFEEKFNIDSTSNKRVGFLWAWNFMLTKKWKSQQTGEDSFHDKIMTDIYKFCRNENDRLVLAWQKYINFGYVPRADSNS